MRAGPRATGGRLIRAVVALLAALSCACGTGAGRPTRIVLVTIDTLRHDVFDAAAMPNTAAFAERGLVFERFFASSSTTQPTHATLFTGLQPWDHGVTRNGVVLADERRTLAEHLRSMGFATRAVVASFPLHAMFGFAQGFDSYVDEFEVPYATVWEGRPTEEGRFFSLADAVTRSALAELDAAPPGDQFFWFHYFDPHDPYGDADPNGGVLTIARLLSSAGSTDAFRGELARARERYRADVRRLDVELGRVLQRLEADEDAFETHVLLTADHGESFGELGALGHGKRVTRAEVHVPCALVSPAVGPERRTDLAGSADVARTLLAAAGLAAGELGGRDLLSERDGALASGMRRTFSEPKRELLADGSSRVLPDPWFFLVRGDELFAGNATLLCAEDDPARVLEEHELTESFEALQRVLEAASSGVEIVDPEVQAALRALGYAR